MFFFKVNLPEKLHSLTLKNEAQDEQQAKYTIVSSSSLSSVSTSEYRLYEIIYVITYVN
jgi:hypothetical protein